MAFKINDIRLDFWKKTSKVRAGSGGVRVVSREMANITDSQGEKFLNARVFGIADYVQISPTTIRRKKVAG